MSAKYLTTGQVARLFSVSSRTAANWFDAGWLEGFRIPGSRARRYRLQSCVELAAAHGIPITLPAAPVRRPKVDSE